MKLPIADTRDTIPCISLATPGDTQPLDVAAMLDEAIERCERASERAVLVAERARMRK